MRLALTAGRDPKTGRISVYVVDRDRLAILGELSEIVSCSIKGELNEADRIILESYSVSLVTGRITSSPWLYNPIPQPTGNPI